MTHTARIPAHWCPARQAEAARRMGEAQDVLAMLGTHVTSNERDTPDEGEQHVFDTWEQEWEDTLLRNVHGRCEDIQHTIEALRWERDSAMEDARMAHLWHGWGSTVRYIVAEAREVNRELIVALRNRRRA